MTGTTARLALQDTASEVVSETYVPLGTSDFAPVIADLERQPVDGVIMLLMGQDAVHFNRQFARAGLTAALPRLSPAVEENTLLAGGAAANEGLYAAAAYFDGLGTAESLGPGPGLLRTLGPLGAGAQRRGRVVLRGDHVPRPGRRRVRLAVGGRRGCPSERALLLQPARAGAPRRQPARPGRLPRRRGRPGVPGRAADRARPLRHLTARR
nr:ABC transporter substrate-binding protein [Nocardioides convexus]